MGNVKGDPELGRDTRSVTNEINKNTQRVEMILAASQVCSVLSTPSPQPPPPRSPSTTTTSIQHGTPTTTVAAKSRGPDRDSGHHPRIDIDQPGRSAQHHPSMPLIYTQNSASRVLTFAHRAVTETQPIYALPRVHRLPRLHPQFAG